MDKKKIRLRDACAWVDEPTSLFAVPGRQCVLLRVDAQLHLLHRLPQEEELLDLPLVLAVETQEVLLRHVLGGDGLAAEETRVGVVGLQELVEVSLDPQLVLQGLDGALVVLRGANREKKGGEEY